MVNDNLSFLIIITEYNWIIIYIRSNSFVEFLDEVERRLRVLHSGRKHGSKFRYFNEVLVVPVVSHESRRLEGTSTETRV